MQDDFDWSRTFVAIEQVNAVALYKNKDGHLVIRQRNSMGEEDSFIIIPMDRVASLAKEMREMAKVAR